MTRRGFSAARAAEVAASGRTALREMSEPVWVHVVVDPSCPRELALAVRDALVPQRSTARVSVAPEAPSALSAGGELPDAALVLVGDARRSLAEAQVILGDGVRVALVTGAGLDAPGLGEGTGVDVVRAAGPEALRVELGAWLAAASDRPVAMAAAFPVCRRAVASVLTLSCASRNALLAALPAPAVADMPVMCANQASLALELAAAHGEGASAERLAEIVGVCAGGLVWRLVARALTSSLPGASLPLRAAVAYAGTLVTGRALERAHEVRRAGRCSGARREPAPAALAPRPGGGYVTVEGGVA